MFSSQFVLSYKWISTWKKIRLQQLKFDSIFSCWIWDNERTERDNYRLTSGINLHLSFLVVLIFTNLINAKWVRGRRILYPCWLNEILPLLDFSLFEIVPYHLLNVAYIVYHLLGFLLQFFVTWLESFPVHGSWNFICWRREKMAIWPVTR